MSSPFGPPPDAAEVRQYLDTHGPHRLLADCQEWGYDPTDLLSIADIVAWIFKCPEHAIALYDRGLEILEANPEQVSTDTNPGGAYCNLGKLLLRLGRTGESERAYSRAMHHLSLGSLSWYLDESVEPVPPGIPTFTFAKLAAEGIPPVVLAEARSAVIVSRSDDRKAWTVGIFCEEDPRGKLQSGTLGDIVVSFYVDPGDDQILGVSVLNPG